MFLAKFNYRRMFMEERKATGMDNNYSMVRLRQLGMAFLLAIVIIGLFAYMGSARLTPQ